MGPQILRPPVEHLDVLADRLPPVEIIRRHGTERDLGDDAECAKRDEGRSEQLLVLRGRAELGRAVAEGDAKRLDVLGQQTMLKTRSVRARRDGAGDALAVDAAQVGHGEAELGQLGAQLVEADAGLHGDHARRLVVGQDAVVLVQVHQPRRGAGQGAGGVGTARGDDAAAALPGGVDERVDLLERLGLDVQLRTVLEGLGPCRTGMVRLDALREMGRRFGAGQNLRQGRIHGRRHDGSWGPFGVGAWQQGVQYRKRSETSLETCPAELIRLLKMMTGTFSDKFVRGRPVSLFSEWGRCYPVVTCQSSHLPYLSRKNF